jgi:hypothetical protein
MGRSLVLLSWLERKVLYFLIHMGEVFFRKFSVAAGLRRLPSLLIYNPIVQALLLPAAQLRSKLSYIQFI